MATPSFTPHETGATPQTSQEMAIKTNGKNACNIVNLRQWQAKNTIAVLEQLLDKARCGEIDGFLFAWIGGGQEHGAGLTGEFRDRPMRALAATERMRHRINELLDEEEDDHG